MLHYLQVLKPVIKIAFLVVLWSGCSEKRKTNNPLATTSVIDSTISVPVDKQTDFMARSTFVYRSKGVEYIVRVNELTNQLQFYDAGKLVSKIRFEVAGPNGIGSILSAHIISMDSILVLPKYRTKMFLADSTGRVYKTFSFDPAKMIGGFYGFIASNSKTPILKFENKLYVEVTQFYEACDLKNVSPIAAKIAEIDLKKETIKNIVQLPEEYVGKFWDMDILDDVSYALIPEKRMLYISFPASAHMYQYNIDTGEILKKRLGTPNIQLVEPYTELVCAEQASDDRKTNKILDLSYYGFCGYSQKQKLFYRFYHLPGNTDPIKPENNNPPTRLAAHRVGVIIASTELEVLAEVLLPDNTFNAYDYFVTDDGLWLSHHSPFNKKLKEDEMKFSLIKVSQ
jgi:hypothetical protein